MKKFHLCVFALLLVCPAAAQEYPLVPQNWFPLETGSYWHYTSEGGEGVIIDSEWIEAAVRDSVVEGVRWTLIETVRCLFGPDCPESIRFWYSFSDDSHLLRRYRDLSAETDTVLPTVPIPVFRVRFSPDTLYSWEATSEYPVVVQIEQNAVGNEQDSTHLVMHAYANIFYGWSFVYNIGPAVGLLGALVRGVDYGDTGDIRSVLLSTEPPQSAIDFHLIPYPNPFSSVLSVALSGHQPGWHKMTIYDLTGRLLHTEGFWASGTQRQLVTWDAKNVSSGAYYIRIENGIGVTASSVAHLVR